MDDLHEVHLTPQPLERFTPIVGAEQVAQIRDAARRVREVLPNQVIWNVNSTAVGGGVAEMLRSLLGYVRHADIDIRWAVIRGNPEFFRLTKRLHHALHGSHGDGSPLGEAERGIYEAVMRENAAELGGRVRKGDFVLLHDPQTAGLVDPLRQCGARVVWRCHIGSDHENEDTQQGWAFLAPYLEHAARLVFTRPAYRPAFCPESRARYIPPSIDAFSPKNQELEPETVRAILARAGLVGGPDPGGAPIFRREDGSPSRVDRRAHVLRLADAPTWDTPIVLQISRWDPLKDPVGVMEGFARHVNGVGRIPSHLMLAGPGVSDVSDDPEQRPVYEEVVRTWHALPQSARARIHLACLPMEDVDENAAIVNALQRHATIVVQKSLQEGFGLTVTEAMWKGRPVVGSAVGGIQDQIDDGVHGRLLRDPRDLASFGDCLQQLLLDASAVRRMGEQARQRVQQQFLGVRHLLAYGELLEDILSAAE